MSEQALMELEKKIKKIKIEAFVVYQDETQIFEYLKNKKVLEKPSKVYSITKSIMGLLIGILVDQGRIKTIHEPIYHYFPEFLSSSDPQKKEITLFHLLTMTSGLQVEDFQSAKNWVKFILDQPVIHKPGTTFEYHNGSSHLLVPLSKKSPELLPQRLLNNFCSIH